MKSIRIFSVVFLAGVASLQMELSFLREASFVLGTRALTNSFVISVFLAGLAIGAYSGNLLTQRLKLPARKLFLISQIINICLILFFLFSKNFIIYGPFNLIKVLFYFGFVTVIPAIVGGMSFSLFLNILYSVGEKHIALVYAISTIGNVLSGFCHGVILIPYFGMISTYIVAIVSSSVAILLMIDFRFLRFSLILLFTIISCFTAAFFRPLPEDIKKNLLFHKDDIYGLVQVYDRSEKWLGPGGSMGLEVFIHNKHNTANSSDNIRWRRNCAKVSMALMDDKASRVLILGYCSGRTVLELLEFESISKILSIEMNKTVIEAAEKFFPHIQKKVNSDSRSEIVIDEFRSYLRRQPPSVKFDIVIIDITISDPYFLGMFTLEFFSDIYKHLEKPGLVFFHSYGTFLRTASEVFDHIYGPASSSLFQDMFFFANFKVRDEKINLNLLREMFPKRRPGKIFSNHKVYKTAADL